MGAPLLRRAAPHVSSGRHVAPIACQDGSKWRKCSPMSANRTCVASISPRSANAFELSVAFSAPDQSRIKDLSSCSDHAAGVCRYGLAGQQHKLGVMDVSILS